MGIAILAAILVAAGGALHFVGLRIAIEARPDIARAMGGVLTQAEQDKIEHSYQEKLKLIQENLQATTEELLQIQKIKDRFMEIATPSAVKSQIPGGNAKGGPLKPANLKPTTDSNLVESLDESLQNVTAFKKNVQEINQLWSKQLTWLSALPTGVPVKGNYSLSSGYGLRVDPFTQMMARHEGLDFSAPVGTPILASAGGVVSRAGYEAQYGNMVEIKHAEGFMTRYAHASQLLVRTGQTVKRGDMIAKVGNTGRSSGPHLHYEVIRAGTHINPANMIPKEH